MSHVHVCFDDRNERCTPDHCSVIGCPHKWAVRISRPDGTEAWMTDTAHELLQWVGTYDEACEEAAERNRVYGRKGFVYRVVLASTDAP